MQDGSATISANTFNITAERQDKSERIVKEGVHILCVYNVQEMKMQLKEKETIWQQLLTEGSA